MVQFWPLTATLAIQTPWKNSYQRELQLRSMFRVVYAINIENRGSVGTSRVVIKCTNQVNSSTRGVNQFVTAALVLSIDVDFEIFWLGSFILLHSFITNMVFL